MKNIRKIISFILTFIITLSALCIPSEAVSFDEGKEALREQFIYGCGPKTGLYSIDYRYYSPAKENDTEKYPLVVWVHGHSHGQYEGYQIESNDIANWTSDEFQSRSEKGFYIMAVRAPENIGISWGEDMVSPLKAAIDDFISKNKDTVDTAKIYIGGFSLGGMMSFKMAINYPDMFAAIFPICPYITITDDDAEKFSDVPVWLIAGKKDPLVGYNNRILKDWSAVISTTNIPEKCRFSTAEKVCMPDGSPAPTEHYLWEAVTYDMFSVENGSYPYISTVDGNGKEVTLTYPDGMISWLISHTSEYNPDNDNSESVNAFNIFKIIIAPFMSIYIFLRNLLRPLFG